MYEGLLKDIIFDDKRNIYCSSSLRKIGDGRSASVFKVPNMNKAIKVFFPHKLEMHQTETAAYEILSNLGGYYLQMYESGISYIVIDFVEGKTLYQCLQDGTFIDEDIVRSVDHALHLARQKGLNPSDIHLKNIIRTTEGIKLIDLARFFQDKKCHRWDHLKKAYYLYYQNPAFPKKYSNRFIERIITLYKTGKIKMS